MKSLMVDHYNFILKLVFVVVGRKWKILGLLYSKRKENRQCLKVFRGFYDIRYQIISNSSQTTL